MTVDPSLFATPVRIGTRGSDLALWQAHHVKARLEQTWGAALTVEIEIITTEGDRIQDRPLHEVGGKGLFVKNIEERLLDARVDLAVHSMKDLPARSPAGLVVACTPEREDPRDVLVVGTEGRPAALAKLPVGTRVGTGSLRRAALVRRINPGVVLVPVRGNVPTRLRKIEQGDVDAVILAAAGLRRLGQGGRVSEVLAVERFCPAPAQGILALQCREDDARVRLLVSPLGDPSTTIAAAAERAFLSRLGASCTVPVGCFAELRSERELAASALVVDPSGRPCFFASGTADPREAAALGERLAEELLVLGADRVADLGERDVA